MNSWACAFLAAAMTSSSLGARLSVADVVENRAMQERRVLRHEPDLRPQAVLGDEGDVLPIDQDAPGFEVVKAQKDTDKRGLARARWPDEADLLARL